MRPTVNGHRRHAPRSRVPPAPCIARSSHDGRREVRRADAVRRDLGRRRRRGRERLPLDLPARYLVSTGAGWMPGEGLELPHRTISRSPSPSVIGVLLARPESRWPAVLRLPVDEPVRELGDESARGTVTPSTSITRATYRRRGGDWQTRRHLPAAGHRYCRAIATRRRSSGPIRWSTSSAAASMSICTQRTVPVNSLSFGP